MNLLLERAKRAQGPQGRAWKVRAACTAAVFGFGPAEPTNAAVRHAVWAAFCRRSGGLRLVAAQ